MRRGAPRPAGTRPAWDAPRLRRHWGAPAAGVLAAVLAVWLPVSLVTSAAPSVSGPVHRPAAPPGPAWPAPVAARLPAAASDDAATVTCRIRDDRLTEVSGLAPSLRHPGILWTHNDSGGGPTLYALDTATCDVRAVVTLADTPARDLEAIATGRSADGTPTIWVADVGDNRDSWGYVRLHAFTEPRVLTDTTLTGRTWRLTYATGANDAEALLADPRAERLWLVTKRALDAGIYALPSQLPALPAGGTLEEPLVLPRVGDAPSVVTDGAVAPDASRWVLRGYGAAVVRSGLPPGGAELAVLDLPPQPQGEAIAWTNDGAALWTVSERDDALWRVPLPTPARAVSAGGAAPATSGSPPAEPAPSAFPAVTPMTTDLGRPGPRWWIWVAAGGLVLIVLIPVAVVLARGRGRRRP